MAFAGKVVIVTGAASGIGAATALEFIKAGAEVAMVDKNKAKLEEVATEGANIGKKPLVIAVDLSNRHKVNTIVKKTIDAFGRLDILVNNAGMSKSGSIMQGNLLESFDEVIATNLRAAIQLTTLAISHIIETKGNVINISNVEGVRVPITDTMMAYCLSKAALNHFTRCAASELASFGVRLNTVSPGPVRTNFLENAALDLKWDNYKEHTVLNKVAEPAEVADLVLYLASDKARSVTGSNYILDNGMCLK